MRKYFMIFACACAFALCGETVNGPVKIPEAQALLSREEQQRGGFDRQRRMTPKSVAVRLSREAAANGWSLLYRTPAAALSKETDIGPDNAAAAMAEFNRAWRFNPENPQALWGAGVIVGTQAQWAAARNEADAERRFEDAVRLLSGAQAIFVGMGDSVDVDLDLAQALYLRGMWRKTHGKNTESAADFQAAEQLLKSILAATPGNDRAISLLKDVAKMREHTESCR